MTAGIRRIDLKLTEHDEVIDRNSAAIAELRALVDRADGVTTTSGLTTLSNYGKATTSASSGVRITSGGTSGASPAVTWRPSFVRQTVAAMLLLLTDHAASYEIHHGQDIDLHAEMMTEIEALTLWLGDQSEGELTAAASLYTRITT